MIPVEGHKHLYRDEKSGAIINCDNTGQNMYMRSKMKKQSQQDRLDEMRDEIDQLKSLLSELVRKQS